MTRRNAIARSVADVAEGIILARVDIAVPPERVFGALTTEELTKWWGSAEVYCTTKFAIDLRPGGRWRSDGVGADGKPFHVEGEVLEVDPPRRLVQTWRQSWDDAPASKVIYTVEPIETGTRVTVKHSGFTSASSCESHAAGWERVLGWLGGFVEPAPELRYFMCKLLPPRATFMQDMNADERSAMQAHAAYWRVKLAEGAAIAFGPVADPAGGYGLGILAVPDEATLRAFQAADPAIVAKIGLRYETTPMVTVVH
jgi:uncharacterized protein YndB with AHSA1/START domain